MKKIHEGAGTSAVKSRGEHLEEAIVQKWNAWNESEKIAPYDADDDIDEKANTALSILISNQETFQGNAKRISSQEVTISKFWKKYGGIDKTPKTDFVIGDTRISLKMGESQLMSGTKGESLATLMSACQDSINGEDIAEQATEIFKNFVDRTIIKEKIAPIKRRMKSGEKPKSKEEEDTRKILEDADKFQKELLEFLSSYFQSDIDFRVAFMKEAMSGLYKFENDPVSISSAKSKGVAEYLMVVADGGRAGFHFINDSTASALAQDLEVRVNWKSSSLRSDPTRQKRGIWTVIRIIARETAEEVDKLAPIETQEALDRYRRMYPGSTINEALLDEGWINDVVERIAIKIKDTISHIMDKVYKIFRNGLESILDFVGVKIEDSDISVTTPSLDRLANEKPTISPESMSKHTETEYEENE